jgi:hypothetical protein
VPRCICINRCVGEGRKECMKVKVKVKVKVKANVDGQCSSKK